MTVIQVMKKTKFPYIVLLPMMLLLFTFIVVPIVSSFVIAFMDYSPLRQDGNAFVGLKNLRALPSDELYLAALRNTLVYVVFFVTINLVLTLMTSALLCALSSNKWRSLFRTAFFVPCIAPLAAITIVWQKCLFPARGGALNMVLSRLGIPPLDWVGNAGTLMPSIILLSLWADVGYNTVLFIAGMQGIPRDFYEAAEIDGASALRRFFSITMPLLTRTFSFVCIMTIISQFQAFAQFSILAPTGGPSRSAYVLGTYIYRQGFVVHDMGYASAVSVTLFLIILAITLVQQRLNRVDWRY